MWLLDPIDGTTNYVHGLPHFSISLAISINKEICYGAIYAPAYKELFYSTRGKGAWLKDLNGKKSRIEENIPIVTDVLSKTHGVRRHGSAALDLAFVSAGRVEGYWELYIDWWGIAAGLLLVEEAGGKYFIINSKSIKNKRNFSKLTLATLATNGQNDIHQYMEKLLRIKLAK